MAKTATEFEKMIHTDRTRKKNEALAAKIFKTDRRASAPIKANGAGSLASRAGVKKQRVVSTSFAPCPGNINTEWTHDLHDENIPRGPKAARAASLGGGSLASRITRPGEAPRGKKNGVVPLTTTRGMQRRAAQVAGALIREEQQAAAGHGRQSNGRSGGGSGGGSGTATPRQQHGPGMSIRGLAAAPDEPLVVMAQNFAPGTTAADIESAMTPVGGLVASCQLVKTAPLVIAEIVFESREGAERVIATFHNQTADGRVLKVYPKVGTAATRTAGAQAPKAVAPTAPRALAGGSSNGNLVDGSLGFDDPMNTDGVGLGPGGRLYSDDLVGSSGTSSSISAPGAGRRGRGGRGGRRR